VTVLTVKRERERELRRDLWTMRDAIDHYKDAADMHAFQTKLDSQNYPPTWKPWSMALKCRAKR